MMISPGPDRDYDIVPKQMLSAMATDYAGTSATLPHLSYDPPTAKSATATFGE